MTEAGDKIAAAIDRQKQSQDAARKTAEEIDAHRERERDSRIAALSPEITATPERET